MPFVGGTLIIVLADDPAQKATATDIVRYYAAVIASFLGAVHWGVAASVAENRGARIRWGVMPALIAWTLLLLPPEAALPGFAALFAAILYVDCWLMPLLDEPYRQLRKRLSVVVVVTLLAATLALRSAG